MTDQEKVIKGTEICLSGGKPDRCRSCPYHLDGCDRQRMLDTLALLKEQEPKPVELRTNAYGTKFYFCPKCKRELFHTRNLNFCERCGQAVKWDE